MKDVLQPWSEDIRSRELSLELLREELEPIPALLQGLAAKLSKVQQAGSAKKKGKAKQKEITGWGVEQRKLVYDIAWGGAVVEEDCPEYNVSAGAG